MPDTPTTAHTVDEALERFQLIGGSTGAPDRNTACVMTALSWVAGESWSDHPRCAHPVLANLAIRTNDHDGTTEGERAEILRAGATGLIDTWWLPGEVVAWCISEGMKAAELPVEQCLATLAAVTAWKATKERPNLGGANLSRANLSRANLAGANLGGAYLSRANLGGANLSRANLGGANLGGANLVDADLGGAYLTYADLGGAYLTYANLGGANLTDANLTGAYLTDADLSRAYLSRANLSRANLGGANLAYANLSRANLTDARCNKYTVPPAGWTVNTTTWRMEKVA